MQKWEYKVIKVSGEKELNELGKQGWELVIVVPTNYDGKLQGELGPFDFSSSYEVAYLKRPA